MSELLQVELIDSSRLLKRYSWSSYSLSSGWIRFEGGRGSVGSWQRRGGRPEQWEPAAMLANGFGRDIKQIWTTGVRYQERVIAEMQEGRIVGRCSDNMLTEYDVSF